MAKDECTLQQKKFCEEYCIDFNGTRAYRAAYPNTKSDAAAGVGAHRLLKIDKIKAYIEEFQSDLQKAAGISAISVLKTLKDFAFSDITETFCLTAEEIKDLPIEVRRLITGFKRTTRSFSVGEKDNEERIVVEEVIELKFADKHKAFELISKILGLNAPEKTINTHVHTEGKPLSKEERQQLNDELEGSY